MTGRGRGCCAGAASSAGPGWRGAGFGRGQGRGWGFGRRAGALADQPSAPEETARPGAQELEQLKRQATALERALGELNARLERLEGPGAHAEEKQGHQGS